MKAAPGDASQNDYRKDCIATIKELDKQIQAMRLQEEAELNGVEFINKIQPIEYVEVAFDADSIPLLRLQPELNNRRSQLSKKTKALATLTEAAHPDKYAALQKQIDKIQTEILQINARIEKTAAN